MSYNDLIASPLTQFEIISLANISAGGTDISFTNASFLMLLSVVFGTIFYQTQMAQGAGSIVPSRWGVVGQGTYSMAYGMVEENTGKENMEEEVGERKDSIPIDLLHFRNEYPGLDVKKEFDEYITYTKQPSKDSFDLWCMEHDESNIYHWQLQEQNMLPEH